jgi:hypothetical protein
LFGVSALPPKQASNRDVRKINNLAALAAGSPQSYPQKPGTGRKSLCFQGLERFF